MGRGGGGGEVREVMRGREEVPLNKLSTETKYDPMGSTIMAKVKARSFTMTALGGGCVVSLGGRLKGDWR